MTIISASIVLAAESSPYTIGAKVQVSHVGIACPELESLSKVINLLREGDSEAAFTGGDRWHCTLLLVGTKGVIRDHSIRSQAVCFRHVGEPDCVWFPEQFIGKE